MSSRNKYCCPSRLARSATVWFGFHAFIFGEGRSGKEGGCGGLTAATYCGVPSEQFGLHPCSEIKGREWYLGSWGGLGEGSNVLVRSPIICECLI